MFKSLKHVFLILSLILKFKKIFNMSKHLKTNFLIFKTNWEEWEQLSIKWKSKLKSNKWKKFKKVKRNKKLIKVINPQILKNKLKKNPSINFKKISLEQSSSKNLMSLGMMLLDFNKLKKLYNKLLYYQLNILKFLLVKELHGKVSYFMDHLELEKLS